MSINKINTTMLQPLIYTKQNTRCILSTFGIGTTYPPLPSSPPTKQYLSIHIRRQGTIHPIITRTQRTTPTRNEMPIYWSIWQSTHSITVPHLSEIICQILLIFGIAPCRRRDEFSCQIYRCHLSTNSWRRIDTNLSLTTTTRNISIARSHGGGERRSPNPILGNKRGHYNNRT